MKYILTVNNGQDKSTLTEKEQQSIESTIVLQGIFFVLDHMVKLHKFTPYNHFIPHGYSHLINLIWTMFAVNRLLLLELRVLW